MSYIVRNGNNYGLGLSNPTATFEVAGDARFSGNMTVVGTTTTTFSENVNIPDNHLYLNAGYTLDTAQTGGLVVNIDPDPTATEALVAGGFVAGVASTSNPTAEVSSSAGFATGDFVQVSGSTSNDGLYEVLALLTTPTRIEVRGIGVTGTVEDFTQNDFVTEAGAGQIDKVKIAVLRVRTDGVWESGTGDSTPVSFAAFGAGSGNVTKVGTPVNNELGVWTGDGTLEGESNLTYDGSAFRLSSTSYAQYVMETDSNTADASPLIDLNRTRNSGAKVEDDDVLANILARGWDGNSYANAARIRMEVDGATADGDMPGRIVFSTTPDGSETLAEAMRITSSGNVGIGKTPTTYALEVEKTVAGVHRLQVENPSTNAAAISQVTVISDSGLGGLSHYSAAAAAPFTDALALACGSTSSGGVVVNAGGASLDIRLMTNSVERMRIANSGQVLVGVTSSEDSAYTLEVDERARTVSEGANASSVSAWHAGTSMPEIFGASSRGTMALPTATQDNDVLAQFSGYGHNGSGYQQAARIVIDAEGTFNGTNYAGNIQFHTTNTSEVSAERVRIDSSGNVHVVQDTAIIGLGAGDDLTLTHNGTNSVIANATGDLQINGVASAEIVVNEGGLDTDFRVEGNECDRLFEVNADAGQGVATVSGGVLINNVNALTSAIPAFALLHINTEGTTQHDSVLHSQFGTTAGTDGSPRHAFIRGRGITADPDPVVAGDALGSLSWSGQYSTTIGQAWTAARIYGEAANNFTGSVGGGEIVLATAKATGSTVEAARVTVAQGFLARREIEAATADPAPAATESRKVFTNEGATGQVTMTLPTAEAGLEFTFVVQDADGISVKAGASDTIRVAASVSAAAGTAASTTVGDTLTLVAINASEWVAVASHGTWTIT